MQSRNKLLEGHKDPLEVVKDRVFRKIWKFGAEVASEEEHSYFAGVIRIFKRGVIHNDWAPRDMKGWRISSVTQQFSWNLFLQSPILGGEFQIWRRYWVEKDEKVYKYNPSRMKGYREEVVTKCESVTLEPKQGRFILFDTRNYHTIHDVKGRKERITMTSFVGIVNENLPIVLWS